MIDGLTFDEESHTYRFKGGKVPGVTSVLEDVGISDFSMVSQEVLAQAQALGTEVHKLIEDSNKSENVNECSDEAMSRLLQYDQFVHDFGLEVIESEVKLFSDKYMYAGTCDLICKLKKIGDGPVLIDFKTGSPTISHKVQTAAYEYAYKKDKRSKMDRYTLYLSRDGYKLSEPYKSRQDFDVFLSALTIYNYKRGK